MAQGFLKQHSGFASQYGKKGFCLRRILNYDRADFL
jgi:hypothetical protein